MSAKQRRNTGVESTKPSGSESSGHQLPPEKIRQLDTALKEWKARRLPALIEVIEARKSRRRTMEAAIEIMNLKEQPLSRDKYEHMVSGFRELMIHEKTPSGWGEAWNEPTLGEIQFRVLTPVETHSEVPPKPPMRAGAIPMIFVEDEKSLEKPPRTVPLVQLMEVAFFQLQYGEPDPSVADAQFDWRYFDPILWRLERCRQVAEWFMNRHCPPDDQFPMLGEVKEEQVPGIANAVRLARGFALNAPPQFDKAVEILNLVSEAMGLLGILLRDQDSTPAPQLMFRWFTLTNLAMQATQVTTELERMPTPELEAKLPGMKAIRRQHGAGRRKDSEKDELVDKLRTLRKQGKQMRECIWSLSQAGVLSLDVKAGTVRMKSGRTMLIKSFEKYFEEAGRTKKDPT